MSPYRSVLEHSSEDDGERLVELMDRFYSLTVSYPDAPERTFVAKYDERDWSGGRC